jgi:hypothetical protein
MGEEDDIPESAWPTGPAAEFVRQKQIELAGLIATRVPVFLDMNFWIAAREAHFGQSNDASAIALYRALEHAVETEKVFCPITADLLDELSKQNEAIRPRTIAVFERLSLGVCLVPHHERTAIEVEALMASAYPGAEPVQRPVWTSFAFIYGYEDLRPPIAASEITDDLLCRMAEKAWMMPPSDLAASLPFDAEQVRAEAEDKASRLNAENLRHAQQIDSLKTAMRVELEGVCSLIERIAENEMLRIARAVGASFERSVPSEPAGAGKIIGRMIAKALENPQHRLSFGSLYVPAAVHAAIRWQKKRKISANDIFDFRHAAAALPYCRAFFTDGPLRTLICSGTTALDKEYDCRVVSDMENALRVLANLLAGDST